MVTPALRDLFAARCAVHAPHANVRMLDGQARRALAAADVVLVASGTATLETALFKRPMVVAYRLGAITAFLLRTLGLVKIKHFSQPNLLAGKELVPEFFQEAASPENLANALARWLTSGDWQGVRFEIRRHDNIVFYLPDDLRTNRKEYVVVIRVLHSDQFDLPLDEKQLQTVKEIETRLKELGCPKDQWKKRPA